MPAPFISLFPVEARVYRRFTLQVINPLASLFRRLATAPRSIDPREFAFAPTLYKLLWQLWAQEMPLILKQADAEIARRTPKSLAEQPPIPAAAASLGRVRKLTRQRFGDEFINALTQRAWTVSLTVSRFTETRARNILAEYVRGDLTTEQAREKMADLLHVMKQRGEMIVETESAWATNAARTEAFKEIGIAEAEFLTSGDPNICPECAALHGTAFKVGTWDYESHMPPIHPRCRCVMSPLVEPADGAEPAGKVFPTPVPRPLPPIVKPLPKDPTKLVPRWNEEMRERFAEMWNITAETGKEAGSAIEISVPYGKTLKAVSESPIVVGTARTVRIQPPPGIGHRYIGIHTHPVVKWEANATFSYNDLYVLMSHFRQDRAVMLNRDYVNILVPGKNATRESSLGKLRRRWRGLRDERMAAGLPAGEPSLQATRALCKEYGYEYHRIPKEVFGLGPVKPVPPPIVKPRPMKPVPPPIVKPPPVKPVKPPIAKPLPKDPTKLVPGFNEAARNQFAEMCETTVKTGKETGVSFVIDPSGKTARPFEPYKIGTKSRVQIPTPEHGESYYTVHTHPGTRSNPNDFFSPGDLCSVMSDPRHKRAVMLNRDYVNIIIPGKSVIRVRSSGLLYAQWNELIDGYMAAGRPFSEACFQATAHLCDRYGYEYHRIPKEVFGL